MNRFKCKAKDFSVFYYSLTPAHTEGSTHVPTFESHNINTNTRNSKAKSKNIDRDDVPWKAPA